MKFVQVGSLGSKIKNRPLGELFCIIFCIAMLCFLNLLLLYFKFCLFLGQKTIGLFCLFFVFAFFLVLFCYLVCFSVLNE